MCFCQLPECVTTWQLIHVFVSPSRCIFIFGRFPNGHWSTPHPCPQQQEMVNNLSATFHQLYIFGNHRIILLILFKLLKYCLPILFWIVSYKTRTENCFSSSSRTRVKEVLWLTCTNVQYLWSKGSPQSQGICNILEEKHNVFMCTRRRFMCTRRRFIYM